jgi:hypothetical protein
MIAWWIAISSGSGEEKFSGGDELELRPVNQFHLHRRKRSRDHCRCGNEQGGVEDDNHARLLFRR